MGSLVLAKGRKISRKGGEPERLIPAFSRPREKVKVYTALPVMSGLGRYQPGSAKSME
jgi:hypothetical protein